MKRTLLFLSFILVCMAMMAQYPVVTIQQIQERSAMDLQNCNDTSLYLGDTVTTHGTVIMDGGQAFSASGHNIWIQSGNGPWAGIDVRDGETADRPTNNLDQLLAGDSIESTAVVERFGGETQLNPIANGVTLLGAGRPVSYSTVSVGDLNNNTQTNQVTTGEQWEGQYIELVGPLTVTTVGAPFSGNRQNFVLSDASGNQIQFTDRFPASRSVNATDGQFVIPQQGARYDTVRGICWHVYPNGCAAGGGLAFGYEITPFLGSDIVVQAGSSAPQISNLSRNPIVPTSSQDVNINVTIEDIDGTVTTTEMYYAVGAANTNYLSVPMTNTGGDNYTAVIPNTAFSDGDFVKYYVCATDNDNLSACFPDVPGSGADPEFFTVRDGGLTIRDIQFTPFPNGRSGYNGATVTVEGVVTASAEPNSLGTVFIQQENETQWAGIILAGNPALSALKEGEKVQVTGTVFDAGNSPSFDFTRIDNITNVMVTGTGTITPVEVDPSNFSTYDAQLTEPYEGMLVTVKTPNTSNRSLYIVDVNADGPTNNFGEYRVGSDLFDPNSGCRVLAGRNTSTAPASLNFSYVNDSAWANNSGIMNVPVYKVTYQDSMVSITGIMYYSFGQMKLLPRRNTDMVDYMGFYGPGIGTAIDGPLAGSEVVAYPNPVADQLNVRYSFPIPANASIVLRDMLGRSVAQRAVNGTEGTVQFSTSDLAQGAYVLTVEAEGAVVARKKVIVT
ncbi:MAG: T9SS type A sorting domain-containing protein [Bacteroidia bacterium]